MKSQIQSNGWIMHVIFAAALMPAVYLAYLRMETEGALPWQKHLGEARQLQVFEFASPDAMNGWEEKTFNGKTVYDVVTEPDGVSALRVQSRSSASAFYRKTAVPVSVRPVLNWQWKATEFPSVKPGGRLGDRAGDDFAARIYVIFKGRSLLASDVIEYIWDPRFEPGTSAVSDYSKHIRLLVVRNAPPADGGWAEESRDIAADYRKLFGKAPSCDIQAVAVMADSDNSRSQAGLLLKRLAFEVPQQYRGGSTT